STGGDVGLKRHAKKMVVILESLAATLGQRLGVFGVLRVCGGRSEDLRMTALLSESVIPVADVPGHGPLRRGGRPVRLAAATRWVRRGVRQASGATIRLEGCRVGRCWYTSSEAVGRFLRRLNDEPSRKHKRTTNLATCGT